MEEGQRQLRAGGSVMRRSCTVSKTASLAASAYAMKACISGALSASPRWLVRWLRRHLAVVGEAHGGPILVIQQLGLADGASRG
jgi:hypothetical protein